MPWDSHPNKPGRTPQGRMAKLSDISRLCRPSGPMGWPSKPQRNGTPGFPATWRSTTSVGAKWPWRVAIPFSSSACSWQLNGLVRKHTKGNRQSEQRVPNEGITTGEALEDMRKLSTCCEERRPANQQKNRYPKCQKEFQSHQAASQTSSAGR